MTETDWHVPSTLLAHFVDNPGAIDDVTAASIEAHLITCAHCRRQMAAVADSTLVLASWAAVTDQIDQPRSTLIERFLQWVGVSSGSARLLGATSALQAASLAAIVVLAGAAAVLSRVADAEGLFLALAPLGPLAAVAVSFAPAVDPGGEAGVATPLHGAALVVRRAVVVLGISFALLALAGLVMPDPGSAALVWILPGLALSLGALALSTWVRVEVAVAGLTSGWLTTLWSMWWISGRDIALADSVTFDTVGQISALAIALTAVAIVAIRRDRFATLEAFR